MQLQAEDIVAVRREMLDLLRQQLEVLNSAPELKDSQLRECYDRQGRVQELREKLQASLNGEPQNRPQMKEGLECELSTADFSTSSAVHAAAPSREPVANL
jgi:small-conductance mechanosensitive channel